MIGNAPVSYGAFEVTVGKHEGVPTATEVLDAVAEAGYDGIDLGPLGFLGDGAELRHALQSRGLLLAGGYVEVDVSADGAQAGGMAELAGSATSSTPCTRMWPPSCSRGRRSHLSASQPRSAARAPASAGAGSSESSATWCGTAQDRGYQAVLHNEVGTQLGTQEDAWCACWSRQPRRCAWTPGT